MPQLIPILRSFDYNKTIEFYIDWLGFKIDWEHKPDGAPFYMQVSIGDITLRLSEHHGDGSPGTHILINQFDGLREYHLGLLEKNYKYNRPGIEVPEWAPDEINVTVIDPFGNQLLFSQKLPNLQETSPS